MSYPYKRIFTIVIDSVGTGGAPDADKFDDVGADTLGHIGEVYEGKWALPYLEQLGLSNLRDEPIMGIPLAEKPLAHYGRMVEQSVGKDSLEGHWEMMGLPVLEPLQFFPDGFPDDLLDKIRNYSGREIVGNKPYSGTKIIEELGEHQLDTGDLIIYTSGDSVLQIAAHEEIIPLAELYDICRYARSLVNGSKYKIGRVIARPFIGTNKDDFERTGNRHDFALEPTGPHYLTRLAENGVHTIGIGKIGDIFSGQGLAETYHNKSNAHGMDHVDRVMQEDFTGFCFVNLVDFDSKYGHRRDPIGFGQELMDFDERLGTVLEHLRDDDLLMITADHGNDPTYKGTDHTREMVPLLVYSKAHSEGKALGTRETFADLGATVLDNFNLLEKDDYGTSFLEELSD